MNMREENGHNQLVTADRQTDAPDAEKQQGISTLARIALGVVVVVALIISVTSVMRYNELETRKAEYEAQVKACDQDIAELQHLINAPVDDEYIARIAHDRYHLYYPDQEIFYSNINK